MKLILSLFDRSGIALKPWVGLGYHLVAIDIEDGDMVNGISRIKKDVRLLKRDRFSGFLCFAFPPCTDLAVSGARHFKKKGDKALHDALELADIGFDICKRFDYWILENPVSRLSTYRGKPNWYYHPFEYCSYIGEPLLRERESYFKKTSIWSNITKPETIPSEYEVTNYILSLGPSRDRQRLRSNTPLGFSIAVMKHITEGERR